MSMKAANKNRANPLSRIYSLPHGDAFLYHITNAVYEKAHIVSLSIIPPVARHVLGRAERGIVSLKQCP